jgi:ABC-type branched-subunit amino acid transport system permease subunit
MTLLLGSIMGFACGWALGRRAIAYVAVGLLWYAALAVQTAHLAHAGTKGFFGIDGLGAVQGRGFAQYWLTQVAILGLIVALFVLGDRLRTRRRERPVAGTAS